MSDGVHVPGELGPVEDGRRQARGRRLVPMQVGQAQVYVEAVDDGASVEPDAGLRPVGVDPTEAFGKASDALRECVSVIGERLDRLGEDVRPHEIGVEFTISFEVEGKANIVPILLSGKATSTMGVKVSAMWKPGAPRT